MSYFVPYIDQSGLHIPSYNDVLESIVSDYKQLFGENIYLDNDSMDYQQISILSKYIYDTYLSLQLAYSSRIVQSAVGVGLDSLASLFSISRRKATKSTVEVTLTGASGTTIVNGKVSDGTNTWLLPATVEIPSNGLITVTAESEQYGPFYTSAGSINTILTPVYGWNSVTNNTSSVPGVEQEPDAVLRNRMVRSSFVPSSTVLEGLYSALLQITGVENVAVYENDTNIVDDNGIPGHSICCVVDGGSDSDVAYQIYLRKTPGVGTYGDVEYQSETFYGNIVTVNFFRPTIKSASITLNVLKLSGWSSSMTTDIEDALLKYVDQLGIGESLYSGMVISIAQGAAQNSTTPAFVVTSVTVSDNVADFKTKVELERSNISIVLS